MEKNKGQGCSVCLPLPVSPHPVLLQSSRMVRAMVEPHKETAAGWGCWVVKTLQIQQLANQAFYLLQGSELDSIPPVARPGRACPASQDDLRQLGGQGQQPQQPYTSDLVPWELHTPFHVYMLAHLSLQDDGNLVAKDVNHAPYWASRSGPGLGAGPFTLYVGVAQADAELLLQPHSSWTGDLLACAAQTITATGSAHAPRSL
jgi:hypothetical protein